MHASDKEAIRGTRFALAPMSPLLLVLTLLLLALPLVFAVAALQGAPFLKIPTVFILGIYAWVWLRFRPRCFVVYPDRVTVQWPLKQLDIPRDDIADVRILDRQQLRAEIGWGLRVGAGGLWGGFGRLQTQKRGSLHLFISRLDRYVWIECHRDQPWLITPVEPEAFVRALQSEAGRSTRAASGAPAPTDRQQ